MTLLSDLKVGEMYWCADKTLRYIIPIKVTQVGRKGRKVSVYQCQVLFEDGTLGTRYLTNEESQYFLKSYNHLSEIQVARSQQIWGDFYPMDYDFLDLIMSKEMKSLVTSYKNAIPNKLLQSAFV